MASRYLIYVLSDPRTGAVRYVGKSCSGLKRPKAHGARKYMETSAHLPVVRWIKKLRTKGLDYQIEVAEELVTADGLADAERFWIAQFKALGFRLLNLTDGGEGAPGHKQPRDVVERRIAPMRGRRLSEEHRRKMSEARKGKQIPLEMRVKISQALTGKKLSEETRRKQSDAHVRRILANPRPIIVRDIKDVIKPSQNGIKRRPVQDETGRIFSSVGEAARAYGLDRTVIRRVAQGKALASGGHIFKYVQS